MAYHDRLIPSFYRAPSGLISHFDYETVEREINHRIGTFEFSGVKGTLHQDKGVSGEIYPWKIYIHGQNYDLLADLFLELTKETGPGFILHPRWGLRRVQILSVKQTEKLATEGGQAVFDVVFQETLEREFPKTKKTGTQSILSKAVDFKEQAIENFKSQISQAIA